MSHIYRSSDDEHYGELIRFITLSALTSIRIINCLCPWLYLRGCYLEHRFRAPARDVAMVHGTASILLPKRLLNKRMTFRFVRATVQRCGSQFGPWDNVSGLFVAAAAAATRSAEGLGVVGQLYRTLSGASDSWRQRSHASDACA
jgi:hypothetical protein